MVRVWQKQEYRIEGQVEGRVNNQETTCENPDLREIFFATVCLATTRQDLFLAVPLRT